MLIFLVVVLETKKLLKQYYVRASPEKRFLVI